MSRASKGNSRLRLTVSGRVQGVGFRPAVYRLADELKLSGTVSNTTSGAVIEVEGPVAIIEKFVRALPRRLPTHCSIATMDHAVLPPSGSKIFRIEKSRAVADAGAQVPPDLNLCASCRAELFNPTDRRYRYPFINCTDCGPRFSIIQGIPYDRRKTTMSAFDLCPACAAEYHEPGNRRFHAQPNACADCGPQLRLIDASGKSLGNGNDALKKCARLIKAGKICAVKGIGGFHLVCDALNATAILTLRARKHRPSKPLAVMARDLRTAAAWCMTTPAERASLSSAARPIVLLRKRPGLHPRVLDILSPGNGALGVMLPYTPLHELLFADGAFTFLVMTSGNRADEPIAIDDDDARARLTGIADAFLVHDRPIHNRCDDSIIQLTGGRRPSVHFIRRSRGYVPEPIPFSAGPSAARIFAAGAELKNTFTLTRGSSAIVSPYMGDLDNEAAIRAYQLSFRRLRSFLDIQPSAIACDLHPDYASTHFAHSYAAKGKLPLIRVQHHHAHVASVLAEHRVTHTSIGIAFDGTGLGTDGMVWGGECFVVTNARFSRCAALEGFPLPGGDLASREIWRLAAGAQAYADIRSALPARYPSDMVRQMVHASLNSPLCSSAGRVFDMVAALAGLRYECDFEAQAAMELESLAAAAPGAARMDFDKKKVYNFTVLPGGAAPASGRDGGVMIVLRDMYRQIAADTAAGISPGIISLTFHRTMAQIIVAMALHARAAGGGTTVCLSGGVFQNRLLLTLAQNRLAAQGFTVLTNAAVPVNDGGISLGQAWCAAHGYRN